MVASRVGRNFSSRLPPCPYLIDRQGLKVDMALLFFCHIVGAGSASIKSDRSANSDRGNLYESHSRLRRGWPMGLAIRRLLLHDKDNITIL